jgi:hypothetical protein
VYILKVDTIRRALAYQVAHTHKRIKLYEQVDPTTGAGQRLREYLGAEADVLFNSSTVSSD